MAALMKLILLLFFVEANYSNKIGIKWIHNRAKATKFDVYWNVPSQLCHKHKIYFQQMLESFGILVNKGEDFIGDKIALLYDPGLFPAMIKNTSSGTFYERNGGIPQSGNLSEHLTEFKDTIKKRIFQDFKGLAIIDFEAWRPIFRQNWNDQVIYRNMSMDLERAKHPHEPEKIIHDLAKASFEAAAKNFMEETLKEAKAERGNALWGYYGYPYCYNCRNGCHGSPDCPLLVQKENDRLKWLFSESTAYYLSIYSKEGLSDLDHRLFVTGRLNEAWRMVKSSSQSPPAKVYPYVWFKYLDNTDKYLSETKMQDALEVTKTYNMGGAILWGSSADVKDQQKCQTLYNYVETVIGPIVQAVKQKKKFSIKNKYIEEFYPDSDYASDYY